MERSLAAILAADVVGYSRLMGEDEAGTLDALKGKVPQAPKRQCWRSEFCLGLGTADLVKPAGHRLRSRRPKSVRAAQSGAR